MNCRYLCSSYGLSKSSISNVIKRKIECMDAFEIMMLTQTGKRQESHRQVQVIVLGVFYRKCEASVN